MSTTPPTNDLTPKVTYTVISEGENRSPPSTSPDRYSHHQHQQQQQQIVTSSSSAKMMSTSSTTTTTNVQTMNTISSSSAVGSTHTPHRSTTSSTTTYVTSTSPALNYGGGGGVRQIHSSSNSNGSSNGAGSFSLTDTQIRDAFVLFDKDGSGQIDALELSYAFRALGIHDAATSSEQQCEAIIRTVDRDGNGKLNYFEFEKLVKQQAPRWDSDEELRYIFNLIDKSGGGLIQLDELRETARYVGEDIDEPTLQRMMREADVLDRDGCVDFKEFKKIMLFGRGGGGSVQPAAASVPRPAMYNDDEEY